MDDSTPGLDQQPQPSQPPQHASGRRARAMLIAGVAALAVGIGCTGIGVALVAGAIGHQPDNPGASPSTLPGLYRQGDGGAGGAGGGDGSRGGFGGYGFRQGDRAPAGATPATAAQKAGVVTVVSKIGFDGREEAAGTGVILTSHGRMLTNNHVVEGSTAIEVTVESTNVTYRAEVVGTDATDDIAVLQLVTGTGADVTGLTPARIDRDRLAVGDAVTDVGNAKGTGNLVAANGTVAALDQGIQVTDDTTGRPKTLSGLIELDADVVAGDSGGPVLDAQGEVTGIATAASSGSAEVTGYAIPISTALSVAERIVAGDASDRVVIGLPAYLGVEVATEQPATGALNAGVIAATPAAASGIGAASIITAVDGTEIDATSLAGAIAVHRVGDRVEIAWTDATGAAHQATVALIAGPAA
jgi:S1-C subfamily serine protease